MHTYKVRKILTEGVENLERGNLWTSVHNSPKSGQPRKKLGRIWLGQWEHS